MFPESTLFLLISYQYERNMMCICCSSVIINHKRQGLALKFSHLSPVPGRIAKGHTTQELVYTQEIQNTNLEFGRQV
ncbi:hypothetical protein F2P79_001432 [Pimephales promelas]|nr:hypothetical protein F2P79_001432 [Pimephales promelas]